MLIRPARALSFWKGPTTARFSLSVMNRSPGHAPYILRRDIFDDLSYIVHAHDQERLAKLAGGVAVIKVGAATEVELKEKKHRVEDALSATRAAVEEGILPGGGVAVINASPVLDKLKVEGDQKTGCDIIKKAVEEPLRWIAINAGQEGSVVVDKVRRSKKGVGYDALNNDYIDMVTKGIIDPLKVTRTALENAASIACMILTTEALVCDIPEKEKMPPMPQMPEY